MATPNQPAPREGGTLTKEYDMIVNLTQHPATPEQRVVGVFDIEGFDLVQLKAALTFEEIPTADEIEHRAQAIAVMAYYELIAKHREDWTVHPRAMIGGALWLMGPLATALRGREIEPVFAFTKRETVEEQQADGSIRKTAVFRHAGFVPAVE
jgi:hypothetical protein